MIVHVSSVEGAVNVASAAPAVVWANGVTLPHVVVKLTTVPSKAGSPVLRVTAAVIVDVPSGSTTGGLAETVTVLMVTGRSSSVTMLTAPLSADAVIFRIVVMSLIVRGSTRTRTNASPSEFVVAVFPLGKLTSQADFRHCM